MRAHEQEDAHVQLEKPPARSASPPARPIHPEGAPVFPIVALGASAGGLEALQQLFSHLPAESGVALVVIQHLDPDRPSMLSKVLGGATKLPVVEAASGMRLEPNRVYVIPAGSDLTVARGVLALVPRKKTGRLHLPIDTFFRSLAVDAKERAIGVVLSGSGADGAEGLRAIKAEGGIAMAQEPDSAQFRSMPDSAIAAGVVDFSGSPATIAGELARLSLHPYVVAEEREKAAPPEPGAEQENTLARIFSALRQQAGVDFSGYKRTSVLRRIERRMALRRASTLAEYASALGDDASESRALANDMLIHVTSFFRDPDAFEALKAHVLADLARRTDVNDPIRIWVPGCATGQEAYSLVMCLLEVFDRPYQEVPIKLFGTDLSDEAIEAARLGVYPDSVLVDVSPERLSRFFERVEGGYRIGRLVRDRCVFVRHDLTRDPPFARLDLISCRNVLIYFDAELQRRVVPMLHYCLKPRGHLFLGQSETITGFRDLFETIDKEHRIFAKTGDRLRHPFPLTVGREAEVNMSEPRPPERQRAREAQREVDHLLLARYAPPGVVVNDRLDIIQFRGRTGAYLEPAPGQPQANVLRMARGGLVAHLHEVVERAKSEKTTTRKEGVRVQLGSETQLVDLEVIPLAAASESGEGYFLILFAPGGPSVAGAERSTGQPSLSGQPAGNESVAEAERVKAELIATKDYLQALISEHQTTTDELAATNEELIAANEELQSANEELQSAKEELQSANEELGTVNDQLHHRNTELDEIANDLVNVLASVEIPVIIVDLALNVRRFTPAVQNIASFIPEDVGRPLDDLKLKVKVDDLPERIHEVVNGLSPREWEVQGHDGRWFRLQIRPYRTSDNRLDGAVLSFVDVDTLRRAIQDAEAARDYAKSIVETVTAALVVLDAELRVVSANEAFHATFGLSANAAQGRSLTEFGADLWQTPALRQALEGALFQQKPFTAVELTTELSALGRRSFSFSGRPLLWGGGARKILLTIDDVTGLRTLEAERALLLDSEKRSRIEAERATRAKDLFLATLSHELRTPLSTILMSAQLLRQIAADDLRIERPSASIERAANAQTSLINDLLDVSRIASGKLMLDLGPVDFAAIVEEAVDIARPAAQAKSLVISTAIDHSIGAIYGDHARLLQVVNNLLTNAIKFTPRDGHIAIRLARNEAKAELTVTDTGMGIRADVLPQLFERFVQADSSVTRMHGGLGLGLSIVRHLVQAHGGRVQAESPGEGQGSTFRITLPIGSTEPGHQAVATRTAVDDIEGIRVLLVEDDDDTREAYAAMLVALGVEVRTATSAAEGLAALTEFQPQVILSDIAMPGEDGFSFIQKVRRRAPEQGGQVPAAAVTALASDEDRKRALRAGFQIHVAKPVDVVQLSIVVRRLADQGKVRRGSTDS